MTQRVASRLSITLQLAGALVAVLLAAGVFAPAEVGAHDCVDMDDRHEDFQSNAVDCTEPTHQNTHTHTVDVDGGRYRDMTFKAYVPDEGRFYDTADDSIVITFHRSFDLPETVPRPMTGSHITVQSSGDGDVEVPILSATVEGKELRLSDNLSGTLDAGEYVTITIKAGAKIETPETPQGFDDFEDEDPYPVSISFVDGATNDDVDAQDKNFVIVKNPIDSTVPNTAVRVELHTHAEARISTADDITVDFSGPSPGSGFDLPSTMATSRIKVFYKEDESATSFKSFNPSEVQIEGERVIFSVPSGKDDAQISFKDDYRIEISKLARVKTPFSAGIKTIRVSSTVDGDEEDIIETVVRRTTTVNPQEGPRGSEFTLEGKGYAPGTVTVYHDADGDEDIDAGETLASVKTVRGAFRTRLTARGTPGDDEYRVRARDSEGDDVSVGFDIRSAMSFEPDPVGLGSSLKVIISDWEEYRNEVVAVQIAGKDAFLAEAVEYDNCIEHPNAAPRDPQGRVTLTVDVPSDIPPGEQTVSVYDHSQLDYVRDVGADRTPEDVADDTKSCHELGEESEWGQRRGELQSSFRTDDPIAITKATVEIVAQALTLSRSEAVRGQEISITGSGFSRTNDGSGDIQKVTVNGEDVAEDPSQFEVSTNGDVALTVTVPVEARAGKNEVQVTGWDGTLGTATLTIPEPSITLAPAEGRAGDRVTVTGRGFVAKQFVRLTYDDEFAGGGQTDAMGGFSLPITVPLTADIGRTYRVTAIMDVEGLKDSPMTAMADYLVLPATVTVTPDWVSPESQMTIKGENLPPYAVVRPVTFGNRDITPVPNISTARNGSFELEVTVPHLPLGDHTLRVEVLGVVVTQVVEVAVPPLSGPPEDVFRELIQADVLVRVWYLDSATQSWSYYDPRPEFASLSTLTQVKSLDVVWVNLSSAWDFQGATLNSGWRLIRLN